MGNKRLQPVCKGCGLKIMITWPDTPDGMKEMEYALDKLGWVGRLCPECWWKLARTFIKEDKKEEKKNV